MSAWRCRSAWYLLVALSTTTSLRLTAQSLSLVEARARALAVSPELRAAREAVAAGTARERQAGAFPNPSVGYFREQTARDGRTNWQHIALLEQPLDLSGRIGARREAAGYRRAALEAEVEVREAELRFEVTRAYALAVAADRRAAGAIAVAEAFAQAQRVSQERRAAGDLSGYAARRIALEAARYGTVRAEAVLARRHARLLLGALLTAEGDSTAVLEVTLPDSLTPAGSPGALDSLRAAAFEQRAELRRAAAEIQARLADARAARREAVPLPVAGLGYKQERAAGDPGSFRGFVLQLSMPLPIWDGKRGAADAAMAESRQGEADRAALRRRIARELEQAWAAAEVVAAELELLRPQLGSEARATLGAAEVAYTEGEISLVEWLDTVRAYQEAEASYAALQAEYAIQRAAVERALGTRHN